MFEVVVGLVGMRTDPEKSWNLKFKVSRPGKSTELDLGAGKS